VSNSSGAKTRELVYAFTTEVTSRADFQTTSGISSSVTMAKSAKTSTQLTQVRYGHAGRNAPVHRIRKRDDAVMHSMPIDDGRWLATSAART
jgi:hypothetical protein